VTDLRPTERFTDRVGDYARYRPDYPPEAVAWIARHAGLSSGDAVADVGSGTGILTARLLDAGFTVWAVEPNAAMRAAAENSLRDRAGFISVNGTAEDTTLPERSVRLVTAAQAYHWFQPGAARTEFRRILAPGGWCALVWNERATAGSPLLEAYEELLRRHCATYPVVVRAAPAADLQQLFADHGWTEQRLPNAQVMDLEGLKGRARSASYVPPPNVPAHHRLMAGLEELFARFSRDGVVEFPYTTEIYVGRLT
jgi:SAM-dependent methyltransferase